MTDLPPYTRTPVTTPDGTPVVGWSGPGGPVPVAEVPAHRLPGCNTRDDQGRCACVRCFCGRPAHGYGTACAEHDVPYTPSDVLEAQVARFCESGGDQ